MDESPAGTADSHRDRSARRAEEGEERTPKPADAKHEPGGQRREHSRQRSAPYLHDFAASDRTASPRDARRMARFLKILRQRH